MSSASHRYGWDVPSWQADPESNPYSDNATERDSVRLAGAARRLGDYGVAGQEVDGTRRKHNPMVVGAIVVAVVIVVSIVVTSVHGLLGGSNTSSGTAVEILGTADQLMSATPSYHMLANSDAGSEEIIVNGPGEASVDIKNGDGEVTFVAGQGAQYLKAPASFYSDKNLVVGQKAADQWVKATPLEQLPLVSDVTDLPRISQCILGRHGSVAVKGTLTLRDVPRADSQVVEVDDRGDGPLGAPAQLYFSLAHHYLVGMDVVNPSPSGLLGGSWGQYQDSGCPGRQDVFGTGLAGMQRYRFDSWGTNLPVGVPDHSVDLTASPWCGAPVGSRLSGAAQSFLQADYDQNRKLSQIDGTGNSQDWATIYPAIQQEISAESSYSDAIGKLGLQGSQKADQDGAVQAVQGTISVLRQGLGAGSAGGWATYGSARASAAQAQSGAISRLKQDLGLPPMGSCSFQIP